LDKLFYNGYVISWIASSIDITYDHQQAILYMNQMDRLLRNDDASLYFRLTRAKAMYLDRWYPRTDARKDLDRAREIIEGMATSQMPLLFGAYRARLINWQLYFPIRDWLEGHPIVRDEAPRLQRWARELRDLLKEDWAKQQKPKSKSDEWNAEWNDAA